MISRFVLCTGWFDGPTHGYLGDGLRLYSFEILRSIPSGDLDDRWFVARELDPAGLVYNLHALTGLYGDHTDQAPPIDLIELESLPTRAAFWFKTRKWDLLGELRLREFRPGFWPAPDHQTQGKQLTAYLEENSIEAIRRAPGIVGHPGLCARQSVGN